MEIDRAGIRIIVTGVSGRNKCVPQRKTGGMMMICSQPFPRCF